MANIPVIYDPVFGASGGGEFVDASDIAAIVESILPVTTLCTPNIKEAAKLAQRVVDDEAGMIVAARAMLARSARGPHWSPAAIWTGDPVDVLVDATDRVRLLRATRLGADMRGTGCVLAAGISASLALGRSLDAAVDEARIFVRRKLTEAADVGGMRLAY